MSLEEIGVTKNLDSALLWNVQEMLGDIVGWAEFDLVALLQLPSFESFLA